MALLGILSAGFARADPCKAIASDHSTKFVGLNIHAAHVTPASDAAALGRFQVCILPECRVRLNRILDLNFGCL